MANKLLSALAAVAEQKAIPDHPVLHGLDPVSTYSPGASRSDAVISQREAPVHTQTYGGAAAVDWVMDCVRLYADTASGADWHLERPDDGVTLVRKKHDGTHPDARIGPSDLYTLLDKPNPFMDYMELVDLLVVDLLLVGNAYWYKHQTGDDGKPLALYRMAPAYVKIVPGPYGPKGFEYQPPGTRNPMKLSREQVIHYRLPNPHSAYYGLGLIQGGGRVFDMEIALTDTQASYYENKADPSIIFQSDRRVPRDVFNKLRAQLRARTSGSRNAGEMLLLEAGLKAETLSPSAKEAMFDVITKLNRDRIFAMFRTSPMLFGMMDTAGSNKVSDARREFDNKTMRPFLDKLQKRITDGLLEPWGVEFKIDYNYTIPQEELLKQAESLAKMPGIKVRELRRFMAPLGLEESTGKPEIDDEILNMPTPEIDAQGMSVDPATGKRVRGDAVGADRPLGSEPGRPPKGSNTRTFNGRRAGQKAVEDTWAEIDERLARAEVKARLTVKQDPVVTKLVGPARPADRLADTRDIDVDAAATAMMRGLASATANLEKALLDITEGKALDDSLTKKIRHSAAWHEFEVALTETLEAGAQQAVSTAAIHQGTLGRQTELDYAKIASAVVNREAGVSSIVQNLKNQMIHRVALALKDEKDIRGVQRVIAEKLQTWQDSHIEAVALTEATQAYNEGTLAVAEAAGIGQVLVEDGHDHDAECAAADGSVWDIQTARENRIEHPRCRRAFTILDA